MSLSFEEGRTAFAGRAGAYEALAPLAAEHRRLAARADYYAAHARGPLGHLERRLFEPDSDRVPASGAVRLLEGAGERAELELVADEISRLLADGVAPAEIAIAVRGGGVSRELMGEVLAEAGVPAAIQRPLPLGDSAIGRALIGLLRCVPRRSDGEPPGTSGDLLAWLRAPGLLRVPALADNLERELRRRGVRSVSRARALWEQRNWPLQALDELQTAQARSPVALIDRCGRELDRLFGAPLQGTATVLVGEQADEALAHAAGRAGAGRAARVGRSAHPSWRPPTRRRWRASWPRSSSSAAVRPVAMRWPYSTPWRCVRGASGRCSCAACRKARSRPSAGAAACCSEEDRFELERFTGVRLGRPEDQLAAERYLLYAAVSRPEELLVLSWHLADDEGLSTSRSLFVEDVCDLFEEHLLEQPPARGCPGRRADRPRSACGHRASSGPGALAAR